MGMQQEGDPLQRVPHRVIPFCSELVLTVRDYSTV